MIYFSIIPNLQKNWKNSTKNVYKPIINILPCFCFTILSHSLGYLNIWEYIADMFLYPLMLQSGNPENNNIQLQIQDMIIQSGKFNTDTMQCATLQTLLKFHQLPKSILLGYYFFMVQNFHVFLTSFNI